MKHTNFTSLAFLVAVSPIALVALGCGGAPPSDGSTSGSAASINGSESTGGAGASGAGASGNGSVALSAADDGGATDLPGIINYAPGVVVSTLAGSGVPGTQDGAGAAAAFDNPTGIALDATGNLVVTDYDSGRVRLVSPAGVVTTVAMGGNFLNPFSVVVAGDGTYYVGADADSLGVRGVMTGTIWSIAPVGNGGIAAPTLVAADFGRPHGLALLGGGTLVVIDRTQDVADQLALAAGQTSLLAGAAGAAGYVDATGGSARFSSPVGAAAMPGGGVVVADSANNRIRLITSGGVVTTLAGTGTGSFVDGRCASAAFNAPRAVAVDAAGNVYVSDTGNHVIRRISVACSVETLAGTGVAGFTDGAGNAAELYGQEGIAVTPDGKTVYVADGNREDGSPYHRVRAIAVP